jgi:hypothetical protein
VRFPSYVGIEGQNEDAGLKARRYYCLSIACHDQSPSELSLPLFLRMIAYNPSFDLMTTTGLQTAAPVRTRLLRILGAGFGVAVVLGATIGVGILRLPGTVAAALGNYWLILLAWIIGGGYTLLGAVSMAELGTMLPQAGGFYVFAKRAFGGFVGFAVGWGDWVNNCAAIAYASAAAAEYCAALFPGLAGHEKAIAIATLGFFVVLHAVGLRLSSLVQKFTSAATAMALIGLAVGCFFAGGGAISPGTERAASALDILNFHGSWLLIIAPIVMALRAIVVAYDGWYQAIYFLEEDVNPARNLPRAMIGGCAPDYRAVSLGESGAPSRAAGASDGRVETAGGGRGTNSVWRLERKDHHDSLAADAFESDQCRAARCDEDYFCDQQRRLDQQRGDARERRRNAAGGDAAIGGDGDDSGGVGDVRENYFDRGGGVRRELLRDLFGGDMAAAARA